MAFYLCYCGWRRWRGWRTSVRGMLLLLLLLLLKYYPEEKNVEYLLLKQKFKKCLNLLKKGSEYT